jgi:hypothetical protein
LRNAARQQQGNDPQFLSVGSTVAIFGRAAGA